MSCRCVSLLLALVIPLQTLLGGDEKGWTLREKKTLGREPGTEIYSATGLAVDDAGSVYVSDQLEYCVKKFTSHGSFAGRTGKRGKGKGEFRSPATVVAWRETVLVMQMNDQEIQLFSRDLRYLGSRRIEGGLPVDIAVTRRGELLVATLSEKKGRQQVLVFPSLLGGEARAISVGSGKAAPLLFGVCRVAGGSDGSIVVLSLFANRVEWYSRAGRLITSVSVPGVEDAGEVPGSGGLPTGTCFKAIQTDPRGGILLLAGSTAQHPGEDVFVLEPNGKFNGVIKLPRPSRLLAVDRRGHLFATAEEGTLVKEYIPSVNPAGTR
jgi:hypothetical protein